MTPFGENIWRKNIVNVPSVLLTISLITVAWTQTSPSEPPRVPPEAGFVSPNQYVSAFFGFSMPLPQNLQLQPYMLHLSSGHYLFGVQAQSKGLTVLTIVATELGSNKPDDKVKEAASISGGHKARVMQIGGKEFWMSESLEKAAASKMKSVKYAVALNGYIVEFFVASFDQQLADKIEKSIRSISFFDPSQAMEKAGPDSHPITPARRD